MTSPIARLAAPQPPRSIPEPLWRTVLGDRLRAARRDRGESLRVVADRASLSMQYLSEIERGRKEPSSEVVAALGRALGLTLLDLTLAASAQLAESTAPSAAPARRDGVALAA